MTDSADTSPDESLCSENVSVDEGRNGNCVKTDGC
jgi:hypothetical protein